MKEKTHDIIRINLSERDGRFFVTVRESPFGETYERENPLFSQLLQDDLFIAQLALLGEGLAGPRELKAIGRNLFRLLIPDSYLDWWRRIKQLSKSRPLALFLHTNTPRLGSWPWELTFDPDLRNFISLDRHFSIVRFQKNALSKEMAPVDGPPNIVALLASPTGLPLLDITEEAQIIQQALAIPLRRHSVSLELVPEATVQALADAVKKKPVHAVHLGAHGNFAAEEPAVVLQDDSGVGDFVGVGRLADLLAAEPPRLLTLTVDRSAGSVLQNDPSLSHLLVERGIPAVVGLQNRTPESVALTFTRAFYQGLADGSSVAQALADARLDMSVGDGEESAGYWYAPVLVTSDLGILHPLITRQGEPAKGISTVFEQATQDAISGRGGSVIGGSQMYQEADDRVKFRGLVSTDTDDGEGLPGTLSALPTAGGTLESASADPLVADPQRIHAALAQLKETIFSATATDRRQQVQAITAYEQIDYEISQQTIDVSAVRGYLSEIDRLLPDAVTQTSTLRQMISS